MARPDPLLFLQIDDGEWLEVATKRLRLGRSPTCDVVIEHAMVSKLHAEILEQYGRYVLRAVSEMFLDGRDAPTFEIRGGEEFRFGRSPHILRLRFDRDHDPRQE